jgi:drug/metabolite transporter (DMT)-like permease
VKNPQLAWIVVSVLCSSVAHFALKVGALRLELSRGTAYALAEVVMNGWLIVGAMLHILALTLWVVGLRHIELSVAYPFVALGVVLVSFLSYTFLREELGATRIFGMLLIASGVMIVARTQ